MRRRAISALAGVIALCLLFLLIALRFAPARTKQSLAVTQNERPPIADGSAVANPDADVRSSPPCHL
jgi:hypothetical protein